MTPLDLPALAALAEAATPGPWFLVGRTQVDAKGVAGAAITWASTALGPKPGDHTIHPEADQAANAAYIAAADPTTILALIRRVQAAEAVMPPHMVPMDRSDVKNLDDVVRLLGIEDSDTTPLEAVAELLDALEQARDGARELLAARQAVDVVVDAARKWKAAVEKPGANPMIEACDLVDAICKHDMLAEIAREDSAT